MTDPAAQPAHKGISLILVPSDAPGFERGRNLAKLGLEGQDASEIFFRDCRVPRTLRSSRSTRVRTRS